MTHSSTVQLLRRVLPLVFVAACSGDANGPGGAAGPVAAGQSQVSVSLASVASGASGVLTLRALDARGRDVGRGGSSVAFATSGGTATGIVGPTTDLGNGSYEATFTGVIAGKATTIGATIDGAPVTTPLPVISVTPGAFSPARSTLTVTPRTLLPGGSATLELIARDAAGNQLETGGLDVTWQVFGGSSVGVIGEVTDHGDGRYTAPFTAGQVGTPLTVLAEVDGVPVASAPPTVTVARGISLEHSVFSIPYDTITVKGGLRLTLQLRDSSDIARTTGGDTVQFIVTAGGDGGDGTISDFTDHDDGTYTANLTGTRSGTVLLGARINGRNMGDALHMVTIQPSPLTPQNSTVRVSKATLAAGDTATLSAELRDLNGDLLTSGDLTVTFSADVEGEHVGGMSGGEIGETRYDGNGVYAAIFTAQRAGTRVTVGTQVGDADLQMLDSSGVSQLPTITVVPGAAAPDSTLVEAAPERIARGDTAIIRLTARDSYGNSLVQGGLAVVFSRTGGPGVSVGHIGPVTDHADGTYTARYFGETPGAPDTIHASAGGIAISSSAPGITVGADCTAGPVSLSVSDLTINDNSSSQFPGKAVTLPSGITTTATLRVSDDNGCPVELPHAVAISAGGGTSTGFFGQTRNLGDGRYTVTFRGRAAGTATQLAATIDGVLVTSSPATVTVVPGDISTKTSRVAPSQTSIAVGDSVVLRMEAYDGAGNRITVGGRTVLFVIENTDAGGVIGPTNDAGDGTYSAVYVATRRFVTDTITARIDGTPIIQRIAVTVTP